MMSLQERESPLGWLVDWLSPDYLSLLSRAADYSMQYHAEIAYDGCYSCLLR